MTHFWPNLVPKLDATAPKFWPLEPKNDPLQEGHFGPF